MSTNSCVVLRVEDDAEADWCGTDSRLHQDVCVQNGANHGAGAADSSTRDPLPLLLLVQTRPILLARPTTSARSRSKMAFSVSESPMPG